MKSKWMIKGVLVSCLFLLVSHASANELVSRVVGVSDGDTITVLDATNALHKVRLSGIDAPEKSQPFGSVAKQSLSDILFGQEVLIHWQKRDNYGRIIGKVMLDDVDINLAQIKAGMAWFYRQYQQQQPLQDQADYAAAEQEAKANKLGLWVDEDSIAPWHFRRVKKR
jgi:endonuclease YncB( thermonuclease family)